MHLYLNQLSLATLFFIATVAHASLPSVDEEIRKITAKYGIENAEQAVARAAQLTNQFNKAYPHEEKGLPFHEYLGSLPIPNIEELSQLQTLIGQKKILQNRL